MDLIQLVLVNNAKQPGNMILFRRFDESQLPIAWFAKYLYPHGRALFSWDPNDMCFVWSAVGAPGKGSAFEIAQMVPADYYGNRAVTFSYDSEHRTYYFKDERPQGEPYEPLTIIQDQTVPPNGACVGIGFAERIAYAVAARPNTLVRFDPRDALYVTFGAANEGHAFDMKDVLPPVRISFPANIRSITVTLGEDNGWTVKENITREEETE